MSGSDKIANRNTYVISSIKRVTRKFQEISPCSCKTKAKQCTKKCAAHAKLWLLFFFAIIKLQ